jgi:hypothetical protein
LGPFVLCFLLSRLSLCCRLSLLRQLILCFLLRQLSLYLLLDLLRRLRRYFQ